MVDLLTEIKEELRQEKFEKFIYNNWKSFLYGSIFILVLASIAVVFNNLENRKSLTLGTQYYKAFQNKESEKYLQVIDADHKGFSPLAILSYASVLASKGKNDEAIKTLNKIIDNKTGYDVVFVQLAKLNKANLLISSKGEEKEIIKLLNELDNNNSIFRFTVQEIKALYLVKINKNEDAKKILNSLSLSENVPISVQERARKILKSF
jgi:hypothetical protein